MLWFVFNLLPTIPLANGKRSSLFCSIVLNNEFSSRLSVGSILRLRAAAITALSQDSTTDTAMIFRLARRFLYVSQYQRNRTQVMEPASDVCSGPIRSQNLNDQACGSQSLFDSLGTFLNHEHALTKNVLIDVYRLEGGTCYNENIGPFMQGARNMIMIFPSLLKLIEGMLLLKVDQMKLLILLPLKSIHMILYLSLWKLFRHLKMHQLVMHRRCICQVL